MGDRADHQYEIYLNGLVGVLPALPTDLTRLEGLAAERMAPVPSAGSAAARAAAARDAPTGRPGTGC
ncbi:hypothetical protein [Actinacidiphila sp. bgisy167]|uniref:hypothetical protein n=1 Tax=Actinacidiphila sp. bgisy167 TaxID=3413797 RepID=UPI003D755935